MNRDIFENLFVLEMTNNHQGSLERGLQIVREHSRIVRFNNVRAAIKLQFRDVDSFVHQDFRDREDIRYVRRVLDTKLRKDDYEQLVVAIRKSGCTARHIFSVTADWDGDGSRLDAAFRDKVFERLEANGRKDLCSEAALLELYYKSMFKLFEINRGNARCLTQILSTGAEQVQQRRIP